jgi:hypothetical protein
MKNVEKPRPNLKGCSVEEDEDYPIKGGLGYNWGM